MAKSKHKKTRNMKNKKTQDFQKNLIAIYWQSAQQKNFKMMTQKHNEIQDNKNNSIKLGKQFTIWNLAKLEILKHFGNKDLSKSV